MSFVIEALQFLKSHASIDEIFLNGKDFAFALTRSGTIEDYTPATTFDSVQTYLFALQEFAHSEGQRFDMAHPLAGGTLSGGFRWQAYIGANGLFCLRRHRFAELDFEHFLCDVSVQKDIHSALDKGLSLLLVGATGSGKTSLLATILRRWFREKRLFIFESIEELPRLSPFWVHLEEQSTLSNSTTRRLQDLVPLSLRLRPDAVALGEIRGREAESFFALAQTGHGGCLATIHGGSIEEGRSRLLELGQKSFLDNPLLSICLKRPGTLQDIRVITN